MSNTILLFTSTSYWHIYVLQFLLYFTEHTITVYLIDSCNPVLCWSIGLQTFPCDGFLAGSQKYLKSS